MQRPFGNVTTFKNTGPTTRETSSPTTNQSEDVAKGYLFNLCVSNYDHKQNPQKKVHLQTDLMSHKYDTKNKKKHMLERTEFIRHFGEPHSTYTSSHNPLDYATGSRNTGTLNSMDTYNADTLELGEKIQQIGVPNRNTNRRLMGDQQGSGMPASEIKDTRNEIQMENNIVAQAFGNFNNGISDMSSRAFDTNLHEAENMSSRAFDTNLHEAIFSAVSDSHTIQSTNTLRQISTDINIQNRRSIINEDNNMLHTRKAKVAKIQTQQENLCDATKMYPPSLHFQSSMHNISEDASTSSADNVCVLQNQSTNHGPINNTEGPSRYSDYMSTNSLDDAYVLQNENNDPTPMNTSDTPNAFRQTPYRTLNSQGVSNLYIDIGDPDWTCNHCGAAFWYAERLKNSTPLHIRYSRCCGEGKVCLQEERDPPDSLKQLLNDKHFMENIRAYNQMFSMTSFGAHIDEKINDGRAPYVFRICGQVCHWLGALCPPENEKPKFLQLYIYDTRNEVENRLRRFGGTQSSSLNPEIVQGLIHILDTHNELVALFRTARDIWEQENVPDFTIRLYNVDGARQYELPSGDIVGAIVFEDGPETKTDYDVIIQKRGERPQRINKLHSTYMSLQFPLLFVYGQPGYTTKLRLEIRNAHGEKPKMSMNTYYIYQLHERPHLYGLLFKGGRLFQQYVVSVYCALEQDRLDFVRAKQNNIRSEYLSGIYDAISRGDRSGADIGKRIILPSSFTGGPRYMYSHYLDALAICRVLGNPQIFITFTCNVNWPEIRRYMQSRQHLSPNDRADIVVRVFQQKVNDFLKILKEGTIFGPATGVLYTIEFQKRGLPHCHTLLWLKSTHKIRSPEDVDKFICAELPDRTTDPEAYKVVTEMMLHGPCGAINPKAPCMQQDVCTKKFPQKYQEKTFFDNNGHVHYRRRKSRHHATKNKVKLDNTYVVPYNRILCLMFHAHINVEYCGWSMLIKYLFKYISKGTDRIAARITRPIGQASTSSNTPTVHVDEIQNFIDGRFICPHEACWRILNFPIHHREPAVQILAVHLEGMQRISFRDKEPLGYVISGDGRTLTTLTQWFEFNSLYEEGHHLTYVDFPSAFVWYENQKTWKPRKHKTKAAIGRLAYVHPAAGELFYFRMLLCHQKGCRSFTEVRRVNNTIFPTYRAACQAMGLLKDDREWEAALQEAAISATSAELRALFAQILLYCDVADTVSLWENHWSLMADDIPARASAMTHIRNLHINNPQMKGYILYELEVILNSSSKSVTDFGLQPPPQKLLDDLNNRLLMEEKNYNHDELKNEADAAITKLNNEQQIIYNLIVQSSARNEQQLVFVYGHGGTGKTFLWKTIINRLRSQGKIVLAVASSGIASLLLPCGRTAHSRFKLPLDLTDESMCHVQKKTMLAELFSQTDLIVWDEAPMND